MREQCKSCQYAEWDYEEYYGDFRQYFVCGCKKDLTVENGECEEYKECEQDVE